MKDCRIAETPLDFKFEIKREIPVQDGKIIAVIAENFAIRDELVSQINRNWEEIRKLRPLPNKDLAYRLL